MDGTSLSTCSIPKSIISILLKASNCCTLEESLTALTEYARTEVGRSELASKNILPSVVELCQYLPYPSDRPLLLLSLKLLRNLCAGELTNQKLFIEQNGFAAVSSVLLAVLGADSDCGVIRFGLQVLANVCLAGEEFQKPLWDQLFPEVLLALSRVQSKETCDPLCMIIYVCCDGNLQFISELCEEKGLPLIAEIVRTVSSVDYREDWFKLLISRICLEGSYFPALFSKLGVTSVCIEDCEETKQTIVPFTSEQAFLLRITSEILNERLREIHIYSDFALFVLSIFKKSVPALGSGYSCKSALPTGSVPVDVLGFSLTILRDICAQRSLQENCEIACGAVDALLSSGLVDLLLCLLRELEPPMIIRKVMRQDKDEPVNNSSSAKPCPYKGFRRDIVAVIGNCAYRRKHVQDEIREKNGILLLLQQCVTDEDNPFLREWGIWSVRNMLEGNTDNQKVVAELEVQGSVDVPEIAELSLRVDVDPQTRRAKLVNVSRTCISSNADSS